MEQEQKPKKSKLLIPILVIVGIIILGLVAWEAYELLKPESPESTACVQEGEKIDLMSGSELECCEGLKGVADLYFDETIGKCQVGGDELSVCVKCGDSVCGIGENKCNCPEDCKKDETADWEVFRNEKWGYEVKYPQDWHIRDCGPVVGFADSISDITPCGEGNKSLTLINISITLGADIESSIEWYKKYSHSFSEEQIELDNQSVTKMTRIIKTDENSPRPELDGVEQDVVFSTIKVEGNRGYIRLSYLKLGDKDLSAVFNQILSTFKFLD